MTGERVDEERHHRRRSRDSRERSHGKRHDHSRERTRDRSPDRSRDERDSYSRRRGNDDDRSRRHDRDRRRDRRDEHYKRHDARDRDSDRDKRLSQRDTELDRSEKGRDVQRSSRSASPPQEKQKPNFSQTGQLAAETNTVNGIVLKYSEPAEARPPPPNQTWHLFVFKDGAVVETIELVQRSCWLIGRERQVADLPVDHPSCSGQHAAIQFRLVTKTNEFGEKSSKISPYIIDLESSNGTTVNGDRIPPSRFVELMPKDLVQFGHSSREYVLMIG